MKKRAQNITDFIKENNTLLPAGFNFIQKVKRRFAKASSSKRQVNVNHFQTDKVLLDEFYKSISRPVNMKLNGKK